MMLSMPLRCRSCPSRSPDGPAPMIATCVRILLSIPPLRPAPSGADYFTSCGTQRGAKQAGFAGLRVVPRLTAAGGDSIKSEAIVYRRSNDRCVLWRHAHGQGCKGSIARMVHSVEL